VHKLLARQLRKHFGSLDAVPEALRPFLASVEAAYVQTDDERAMLERSMENVSLELADRYHRLRNALDEKDGVSQALSVLTATLESTADGIVVVDLEGRIVRSNRRFATLLQLPESVLAVRDETSMLAHLALLVEDPVGLVSEVRAAADDPGRATSDMVRFTDGRVFERYSLPQRIANETIGRVWTWRDVTEQRSLTTQLQQAQKMEAVGRLAGGIAHDFNNLMTVITANAEFLQEDLPPGSSQASDVDEIIKSARRATALTQQLLAFSRKQMLRLAVLDLNAVVHDVEPMLRRLIAEHIGIEIQTPAERCLVSADRSQMEQALLNLAINARDAMPQGGVLHIRTARARVTPPEAAVTGAVPAGEWILLEVRDTGTGIKREHLDRIFEPFFSTKAMGRGTGLGLSMLYGIVTQAGGHITVDSEPGTGSRFSIYLPETTGIPEVEEKEAPAELSEGHGEVVLVAEDEDAIRTLMRRSLESAGCTVICASNGAEALRLVRDGLAKIDLLVTDMLMPGLGGRELAEALRVLHPALRVLYVSGHSEDLVERTGLVDDHSHFLAKPFSARALGMAVRTLLDTPHA
jgi:two-component system cell cycle sensor histidine kinase/response regulator CckA